MISLGITALVGIAAIVCLVNPVAGLCSYLITIIIRPNEWIEGIKIPAIPAMIVMMSMSYMVHMGRILPLPEFEDVKPLRSGKLLVAMVVLVVLHFIVFPSGYPLIAYILGEGAPTILLLVYFTRHINTPDRLQWTLSCITGASLFMGANAGYVHFYRKGAPEWAETEMGVRYLGYGEPWNSYHLNGMRLQGHENGIWSNPNDFGMLINWGILGCLFYLRRQGSKLLKLAAMGAMAFLAGILFLTGSRGGQLQLGINLWMVLVGGKRKMLGIFLLVIALVGALVVLPRLSPERSDSSASKDERTELLMAAYRMFKMYPIYGCGFIRFPQLNDFKTLFPHNVYAQVLAEMGIIGGLVFFSLIWVLRKEASAAVKWFQKFAPFNQAHLATCVGALQLSYSVFILFSNQLMRYTFAMVMTMAMALYNIYLHSRAAQEAAAEPETDASDGDARQPLTAEAELIENENVSVRHMPDGDRRYEFDPRRPDGGRSLDDPDRGRGGPPRRRLPPGRGGRR